MPTPDLKQRILAAAQAGLMFNASGIAGQLGASIADAFQSCCSLERAGKITKEELDGAIWFSVPAAVQEANSQFRKGLTGSKDFEEQMHFRRQQKYTPVKYRK